MSDAQQPDATRDDEDTAEPSGDKLHGKADERTSSDVGAMDGSAAVGAGGMQSADRDDSFLTPDDATES